MKQTKTSRSAYLNGEIKLADVIFSVFLNEQNSEKKCHVFVFNTPYFDRVYQLVI